MHKQSVGNCNVFHDYKFRLSSPLSKVLFHISFRYIIYTYYDIKGYSLSRLQVTIRYHQQSHVGRCLSSGLEDVPHCSPTGTLGHVCSNGHPAKHTYIRCRHINQKEDIIHFFSNCLQCTELDLIQFVFYCGNTILYYTIIS